MANNKNKSAFFFTSLVIHQMYSLFWLTEEVLEQDLWESIKANIVTIKAVVFLNL